MEFQVKMRRRLLLLLTAIVCVDAQASPAHSVWGCTDNLSLRCPQDGDQNEAEHILIQRAFYGHYDSCQPGQCCRPVQEDCQVSVNASFPSDLEDMKELCDNQTACSLPTTIGVILSRWCGPGSFAQFQVVHYTCVYEDGGPQTTRPPPTTTTTTTTTSTTTTPAPSTAETTEPPPVPSSSAPPPTGGDSTNIGGIVGGVLGAVCGVGIAIVVAVLCVKRKNLKEQRPCRRKPQNVRVVNGVYSNEAFDEEMDLGDSKTRIRALSQLSESPRDSHLYEHASPPSRTSNSNLQQANGAQDKRNSNVPAGASTDPKRASQVTENVPSDKAKDRKSISPSENGAVKNSPAKPGPPKTPPPSRPTGAKPQLTPPAATSTPQKFEKGGASSKPSAPVAKRQAGPAPQLSKAASAVDVSLQPKLEKQSPHKHSAPCLGGSALSMPTEKLALPVSGSAKERRSVAEPLAPVAEDSQPASPAQPDQASPEGEGKADSPAGQGSAGSKEKGPGKELF